jgi:hypothetical protein
MQPGSYEWKMNKIEFLSLIEDGGLGIIKIHNLFFIFVYLYAPSTDMHLSGGSVRNHIFLILKAGL